jgi:hypothetical protein
MGLEPTVNTAESARSYGLTLFNMALSNRSAERLVSEHGQWDCVVLRQVLEHIGDLDDFGRALNRLLSVGAMLVVEVPDSRLHYQRGDYALWEEHVNLFTPKTVGDFLLQHGFRVKEHYTTDFSGVCLTVIASKEADTWSNDPTIRPDADAEAQEEAGHFRNWAARFPGLRAAINSELEEHHSRHGSIALYGVGCRSSSFINVMEVTNLVEFAIDDQPQKQGKFMPGSSIPIISSQDAETRIHPETLVLLGVNGENELSLVGTTPLVAGRNFASVLPPSSHLLKAWGSYPQPVE